MSNIVPLNRNISAYLFYSAQRRPEVKSEDETLSRNKISRIVAAEWKHMNDEEKEIYQRIADKERYEMAK